MVPVSNASSGNCAARNKLFPWIRAALVGIGVCGVLGPALPLLITIPKDAFGEKHSFLYAVGSLRFLLFFWPFAVVAMGPAGAIFGAIGALWIQVRSRTRARKYLLAEAVVVGSGLGALVPFPIYYFSSGSNRDALVAFMLMGTLSGAVCGVLVFLALRKLGLLFLPGASNSDAG